MVDADSLRQVCEAIAVQQLQQSPMDSAHQPWPVEHQG